MHRWNGILTICLLAVVLAAAKSSTVQFAAVLLLGLLLNSRIVRAYLARRQVNHPMVGIDFPNGLPSTMLGVRIAFFVIVAAMVTFGAFPMEESTAKGRHHRPRELTKPTVCGFPKLLVCLDCGASRFTTLENELARLTRTHQAATSVAV